MYNIIYSRITSRGDKIYLEEFRIYDLQGPAAGTSDAADNIILTAHH